MRRSTADRGNIVIVVVNLDPHGVHAGEIVLPLDELGFAADAGIFGRGGVYRTRRRVARRAPARHLDPEINPALMFRLLPADAA